MDTTMPLATGTLGEDLVRGVASVLLVHAFVVPLPCLSQDVESFAIWLIARRFSTLLGKYGLLEMTAAICVGLAIVQSVSKRWGGVVLSLVSNLFVLVASFLLSEWIMEGAQTGMVGDSIIVMISMLSVGRLVVSLLSWDGK
jgi:hypothetical protein